MNIESLTLGEVAKVEELGKAPITNLGSEDKPQGLLMAALAFVIKRREDPKFTFNDAMNMSYEDIAELIGGGEEDDDEQGKS